MLNLPLNMPAEKLRTVEAMAEAFQNVSNVVAVVLGGSYARGFARPDSDIDMDIYYRQASPCSVDQMRSVAEMFCKVGSVPIVTGPVRVGPLNGGAWIQTLSQAHAESHGKTPTATAQAGPPGACEATLTTT